jgi:subtilase family serine protease
MRAGRSIRRVVVAVAALASAGTLVVAAAGVSGSAPSAGPAWVVAIHPSEIHLGSTDPHALTTAAQGPPTTAQCEAAYQVPCYQPFQLKRAYDLAPLYAKGVDGNGQTIIIVDAYGSPTIGTDLAVFDKAFHLPAPPSLTVIQPAGPVPPYKPNSNREGWAGETDLDVEYSHMIAPDANILLVETPVNENEGTSGFPQIETAEKYVIAHHMGGVISQSFSATEQTFPTTASLLDLRGAYVAAAKQGITVLAASGDSGAADVDAAGRYYKFPVTSWPDSDPLVTGVGGTRLHLDDSGAELSPTAVWNDTYNKATQKFIDGSPAPEPLAGGGGLSIIFKRPDYQKSVAGVVGQRRGVPDIAMSGACDGAVDVYQGFPGQVGWFPTCGTSEATPLFAGMVSLADQVAGHPLGLINPALYEMSAAKAPGIVDITAGNNTVSYQTANHQQTVNGFVAIPGYDLASGVGTVDAASFVPELAAAAPSPTPSSGG